MADWRMIEAAEWDERLAAGASPSVRAQFETWRADAANAAAWHRVESASATCAALADHPDLLALRHGAVARTTFARPPLSRRAAPWMLAAAACAAIVAPLALLRSAGDKPAVAIPAEPVYRTAPGQRLVVTLADGSRLTLDTASQVRVAYTDTERRLILERGQALFEVAKHQPRPFVVMAGGHAVTAHGTAFDVRLDPRSVQVALVEGKVTVAPSGRPARAVAMVPDDVLTASAGGLSVRHVPGLAETLANWSEGRLVFEDAALGDAVAEMNRYGARPIAVADARAAAMRISGSFRTGEIEPFLEALQLGFPVAVRRPAEGPIVIAALD